MFDKQSYKGPKAANEDRCTKFQIIDSGILNLNSALDVYYWYHIPKQFYSYFAWNSHSPTFLLCLIGNRLRKQYVLWIKLTGYTQHVLERLYQIRRLWIGWML